MLFVSLGLFIVLELWCESLQSRGNTVGPHGKGEIAA